jgi:hypothetical protein
MHEHLQISTHNNRKNFVKSWYLYAFWGAIRVVNRYGLAKGNACSGRASGLELGLVTLRDQMGGIT